MYAHGGPPTCVRAYVVARAAASFQSISPAIRTDSDFGAFEKNLSARWASFAWHSVNIQRFSDRIMNEWGRVSVNREIGKAAARTRIQADKPGSDSSGPSTTGLAEQPVALWAFSGTEKSLAYELLTSA